MFCFHLFQGGLLSGSVVGLMATSSKRTIPHTLPSRFLQPETLSPQQATADLCLHRRQRLKVRSGSDSCGYHCSFPWILVHKRFCLHPLSVSNRYEVYLKCDFAPFYHLVQVSSLPLVIGYHFLVGFNIPLLMVVQQLVAILVFSRRR